MPNEANDLFRNSRLFVVFILDHVFSGGLSDLRANSWWDYLSFRALPTSGTARSPLRRAKRP